MAGSRRPGASRGGAKGDRKGLDAEALALWHKVTATVRPIDPRRGAETDAGNGELAGDSSRPGPKRPAPAVRPPLPTAPSTARGGAFNTLDAGWDRRLRRGLVAPERTIDLHGHTLASAHAALETAIAGAVAADIRVLLVVTGRPPRPGAPGRGLIRAAIPDWLAASGWSSRIAAVRNAHPRHGGAGALYLVLRRRR